MRVIVLTGASSGIGRAAAIAFARAADGPIQLLLVARRMDALEQTRDLVQAAAATNPRPVSLTIDLLSHDLAGPEAAERLAADIRARCDHVDVLVNNAGAGTSHPFESPAAVADTDSLLALNLRTPIILTQLLLPELTHAGGTVVNVASVAGLVGTAGAPVYSTTKWGLVGASEALDSRLRHTGVRVMCVLPGPVPTPGWPHARLARRPLLRWIGASSPDAIARSIVRAAARRGSPMKVRPRSYHVLPWLRAGAPWFIRHLLPYARRFEGRGDA